MSQRVEIVSNIQPEKIGLNVRHDGPQSSISVRSFSPITNRCTTWLFLSRTVDEARSWLRRMVLH